MEGGVNLASVLSRWIKGMTLRVFSSSGLVRECGNRKYTLLTGSVATKALAGSFLSALPQDIY